MAMSARKQAACSQKAILVYNVAAVVLVFIEAMGAFITPQLLGGPADTMIAMLVQQRFLASYDWPLGSAVAVIYLVFTGLLMYASRAARDLLARRTAGGVS